MGRRGGGAGGPYARNMVEDVDHFRSREKEEEGQEEARNEGGEGASKRRKERELTTHSDLCPTTAAASSREYPRML